MNKQYFTNNLIYFLTGLLMLSGFMLLNVMRLAKHTLYDGHPPVFDISRKLTADEAVIVHRYDQPNAEVL